MTSWNDLYDYALAELGFDEHEAGAYADVHTDQVVDGVERSREAFLTDETKEA